MNSHTLKNLKSFVNSQRKVKILIEQSELEEKTFGQLYLIEVMPGATVGNHYHEHRQELLIPLEGIGNLILEDIATKMQDSVPLDANTQSKVIIPPYAAHAIINTSNNPLRLIEYSTRPFDQNKEDKIIYEVKIK